MRSRLRRLRRTRKCMTQKQTRRKPLRQRVMKMIQKSPIGKNTFFILVEAYSKCFAIWDLVVCLSTHSSNFKG